MRGSLNPEKQNIAPELTSIGEEEANMDFISSKGREIVIDIDRCVDASRQVGNPALVDDKTGNSVSLKVCSIPESVDEGKDSGNLKTRDEITQGIGKNSKREKWKPASVKKSPKPPRPPRGTLSLDAADKKLIKELAQLAMLKRAKIERMKAMRAAKASSSSGGNVMAILFSIIFFAMIILQGCHSSHGNRSSVPIQSSLESSSVDQQNMFASGVPLTNVESPNIMQPVGGSYIAKAEAEKSEN